MKTRKCFLSCKGIRVSRLIGVKIGTDGMKMTSIQILELDGSVELQVGLLPVDLEAKLCTGLEDEGNLVVCHARRQSGDVQNGFVKIRMRFGVVSDGHAQVGHRGCCHQEKRARRRNRRGGE